MLASWVAMGMIEVGSRMKKISNYKKLFIL
jgi:hypothetical protein